MILNLICFLQLSIIIVALTKTPLKLFFQIKCWTKVFLLHKQIIVKIILNLLKVPSIIQLLQDFLSLIKLLEIKNSNNNHRYHKTSTIITPSLPHKLSKYSLQLLLKIMANKKWEVYLLIHHSQRSVS